MIETRLGRSADEDVASAVVLEAMIVFNLFAPRGVGLQLIFRAGDLLHVEESVCATWRKSDLNQFWKSSID